MAQLDWGEEMCGRWICFRCFTQVVTSRYDFSWFFVIKNQPRADLNKVRDEGRDEASHDCRVSQQNELVNHSNLETLLCDCKFKRNDWKRNKHEQWKWSNQIIKRERGRQQNSSFGSTFSQTRVVQKSFVLSVTPHVHRYEIADVGWNFAFHDCRIAPYDVLIISFNLKILNYGLKIKKEIKETVRRKFTESGMGWERITKTLPDSKAPPPVISCPLSSIHATTWTKSATKLGIKHLMIAELPRITYSLGVSSAAYTWLMTDNRRGKM